MRIFLTELCSKQWAIPKENHKAGTKASRKVLCGPRSQGFVSRLEEESQNMFGLLNSDCKNLQPLCTKTPLGFP